MAEMSASTRLIRFEDFELDILAGELRKNSARLKLTGQPLLLLAALTEQPGEVVTRDQLQKRLWPDTFVDVDHNLNTAINKIREALGDSAERPRYIETIPRRGYRFIGELKASEAAAVATEPDLTILTSRDWPQFGMGMLAFLVVCGAVIGLGSWYRYAASAERQPETTSSIPVPFTAQAGAEVSPAFSPDGSRIAFAWNGHSAGDQGFDLYVKAIGSETMLRLTEHPSESLSPVWSPDGTQIAFHRVAGADTGIYVMSALGGPERKLHATAIARGDYTLIGRHDFTHISWSPDGKSIAFVDIAAPGQNPRIYLLSTDTLEARQMFETSQCLGEGLPSFSHNGQFLAYWCVGQEQHGVLYSAPAKGGQQRKVLALHAYLNGLTWSADDQKLVYSLFLFENGIAAELDEIAVAGGSTAKKLLFAGSAMSPAVTQRGEKLAYSSLFTKTSLWRRDLLHPDLPAIEFSPSSREQFDAQYSPDGEHIAFGSRRSGLQGVWMSEEDGGNLVQISEPDRVSGSPQWSPDSRRIAFDSYRNDQWEIYVADVFERKPRRLVTNVSDLIRPHWSRDGKWIYFRSNEARRAGLYRCPASGGDAVAVAKDSAGVSPQESFDGKTLFFANSENKSRLKRMAIFGEPGTESEVDGMPLVNESRLWELSAGGVYFVPAESKRSVRYFDFASRKMREVFSLDSDFGRGLSVSPDGRWILYSQVREVNSDIMLVDHFR